MGRVAASVQVPGRVADAEALWYDRVRWQAWVDGFGHVVDLSETWPRAGSRLVWDAPPGGRGRVVERVVVHEARAGQELDVEDARLRGRRTVAFAPGADSATVSVAFAYELKHRHALSWAVDLLSVRRNEAAALRRTLHRFARERVGDLEWEARESR
jgi:hypothetical protein